MKRLLRDIWRLIARRKRGYIIITYQDNGQLTCSHTTPNLKTPAILDTICTTMEYSKAYQPSDTEIDAMIQPRGVGADE